MANNVVLFVFGIYVTLGTVVLSTYKHAPVWWVLFILHVVALTASVLIIWSPRRRGWLTGHLRHRRFNQLYLMLLKPLLGRALGWFGQELLLGDRRGLGRTFLDGLTYRLFDRALLIAVAYPLLLLFAYWAVTGADGKLGGTVLFPAEDSPWLRAVAVCLIAMVLLSPVASARAAASPKRFVRSVSGLLPFVAGAVVVAVAGAFLVAGLGSGAVAGAGAVAVAGASAFAGAVAVAGGVAVVFVFAVALTAERRSGMPIGGPILLGMLAAMVAIGLIAVDWTEVPSRTRGLVIFLAVFPLLNAAFDVLSYAATLALTQRGLRAGPWAVWFGVLDFVLAGFLFLALGATLIAAIAAINSLAGVTFVDLGTELARIGDWREYWWAYAMVFSTLIPTALHGLIAAFSLQACVPFSWRERLATAVERSGTESDEALLAVFGISSIWLFSIAASLALIGGVIWLARGWLFEAGAAYRGFLIDVAHWFGAF